MSPSLMFRSAAFVLSMLFACGAFAQPSFQTNSEFRAIPTFHSLSLYWSPPGKGTGQVAEVEYKVSGDPDSAYKRGLDLWYDYRTPAPSGGTQGEYRGSLVHLQPNTAYDIRLTLNPSGQRLVVAAQTGCAAGQSCTKTWSEDFDAMIGSTKTISSGLLNSPIVITAADSGSPGAYKLITAAGQIDGTNLPRTTDWLGAEGSCIVIMPGTHHIIIRGLKIRACGRSGILMHSDRGTAQNLTHDIVIEDNEISGYGNVTRDAAVTCNYNDDNNEAVRPERLIIQKNRFHSPRFSAKAWYPDGHPEGPNAIELNYCNGNHVIRYNEVYSTNNNFFRDGLGGDANFGYESQSWFSVQNKGSPFADSDLYGNVLTHIYDDGFESEGANRNVRIWGNYFDKIFIPIGNANNSMGPLYVWRNVSHSLGGMNRKPWCAPNGPCPAGTPPAAPDAEDRGPFVKAGGRSGERRGGRGYYFHNTILQPPSAYCDGQNLPCGAGSAFRDDDRDHYNFVSRNNLWQIHKPTHVSGQWKFWAIIANCSLGNAADQTDCKLSHDMYNGGLISGATVTTPPNWSNVPPTYATSDPANPGYPGTSSIPTAANGWKGDFTLKSGTTGRGQALVLFNFNDQYASPDVGAHQSVASGTQTAMVFGIPAAASGPSGPTAPTAVLDIELDPASGDAPLTVTFYASNSDEGTHPIASLKLEFGDNSEPKIWTDKDVPQSHIYSVGTYTARLTVSDNQNPPNTSTTTRQIKALCSPSVRPTARMSVTPTSGDKPLLVNFDASASTAISPATITEYKIVYGDGGNGTGATQSHTYNSANTFTARLTVKDSNQCESEEFRQDITVTTPPSTGSQTVTLREGLNGYAGTQDVDPLSAFPDTTRGTVSVLNTNWSTSTILVRFKIFASEGGPVPDNATITSATLKLYKYEGPTSTYNARRVLKNWQEMQATWNVAAAGLPWQTAGAQGSADVAASADSQALAPSPAGWLDLDVTPSVQAFRSGTPNYGWRVGWVGGTTGQKTFYSRNAGSTWAALRPTLTVVYTLASPGSTVTLQEGLNSYVGTQDVDPLSAFPDTTRGTVSVLNTNWSTSTILMRFKIFASEGGPVPDNATITSATLSLYKYEGPTSTYEARRVLKNWQEMAATWNVAATGLPWQTPGAQASTDVAASADSQAVAPSPTGWLTLDVTPSVQAFRTGTPNHGWRVGWVGGTTGQKSFYSRNAGGNLVTLRPKLTINYQ